MASYKERGLKSIQTGHLMPSSARGRLGLLSLGPPKLGRLNCFTRSTKPNGSGDGIGRAPTDNATKVPSLSADPKLTRRGTRIAPGFIITWGAGELEFSARAIEQRASSTLGKTPELWNPSTEGVAQSGQMLVALTKISTRRHSRQTGVGAVIGRSHGVGALRWTIPAKSLR